MKHPFFTGNKYTREANFKDNPTENEQESMEQSEESDNGDVTHAKETKQQSSDRAKIRSLPASIRKLDEDSGDSQESSNEWEPEEPEDFGLLTSLFSLSLSFSLVPTLQVWSHSF